MTNARGAIYSIESAIWDILRLFSGTCCLLDNLNRLKM